MPHFIRINFDWSAIMGSVEVLGPIGAANYEIHAGRDPWSYSTITSAPCPSFGWVLTNRKAATPAEVGSNGVP
jgi:hypothetical protein